MNAIERRQYEMLVRVRDFGDKYGHLFPTSSVAREKLAEVAAAIGELDRQELTRVATSASALVERKAVARRALVDGLEAISQTARVLVQDAPGVEQQFQMPVHASDQTLLTTGRQFAQDVEPFSSQFLAHGMPVTFVADMSALVDAFERALRERGVGRGTRRAARASTRAALASGIAAVRSLTAIVTNHLRHDAVTTTVWKEARRVVYRRRMNAPAAHESPTGTKAA